MESLLYINCSLMTGTTEVVCLTPWVPTIPSSVESVSYTMCVLQQSEGSATAGLYIKSQNNRWRYIAPYTALVGAIATAASVTVYQSVFELTPIQAGSIVYRNGILVPPTELEVAAGSIYVVVTPIIPYSLPAATTTVIGGVKQGSGVTIESDGTLNVNVGGVGTVTSVALALPAMFSVSGTPITTAGTLDVSLSEQIPNTFFAGPLGTTSNVPSWRILDESDIPAIYLTIANAEILYVPLDGSKPLPQGLTVNGVGLTTTFVTSSGSISGTTGSFSGGVRGSSFTTSGGNTVLNDGTLQIADITATSVSTGSLEASTINTTAGITAAGVITGTNSLVINGIAESARYVIATTAESTRWQFGVNSDAESGSNAGSNFSILSYSDNGDMLATPLVINRASSRASFAVRPIFNAATPWDSANFTPSDYLLLTGGTVTGTVTAVSFASYGGDSSLTDAGLSTPVVVTTSLNVSGEGIFTQRPTFNNATPWDSSNFTPSNYLTTTTATSIYLTIANATSTYLPSAIAAETYAPLNNPTISGKLTVDGTFTQIDGPAGAYKIFATSTAGLLRWQVGNDEALETGSNAGSNFGLWACSDAGNTIANALAISRATQVATFSQRPIFGTATPWDSANFTPSNYAPLGSPAAFTNTITVPTAAIGDSSGKAASTAFVASAIQNGVGVPYDVVQQYVGVYPPPAITANQIIFSYISNRSIIVNSLPGCAVFVTIPSTNPVVFSVTLNGTQVATLTINNTTVTWSTEASITIPRNSQFMIQAPGTIAIGETLAGVGITLSAQTTAPEGG